MQINNYSLPELSVGQTEQFEMIVTPEHLDAFSELSSDYSPLHTDESFAKKRGFQGRVAHGLYLGALVSRLIGNQLPGANGILQSLEMSFRRPLVPPQKVIVRGKITQISQSTGQISIDVELKDGEGQLIAGAKVKSIVRGPA